LFEKIEYSPKFPGLLKNDYPGRGGGDPFPSPYE